MSTRLLLSLCNETKVLEQQRPNDYCTLLIDNMAGRLAMLISERSSPDAADADSPQAMLAAAAAPKTSIWRLAVTISAG